MNLRLLPARKKVTFRGEFRFGANSLNLGVARSEGREGREGRIKIRGNRTWPQKLALIGIK